MKRAKKTTVKGRIHIKGRQVVFTLMIDAGTKKLAEKVVKERGQLVIDRFLNLFQQAIMESGERELPYA